MFLIAYINYIFYLSELDASPYVSFSFFLSSICACEREGAFCEEEKYDADENSAPPPPLFFRPRSPLLWGERDLSLRLLQPRSGDDFLAVNRSNFMDSEPL